MDGGCWEKRGWGEWVDGEKGGDCDCGDGRRRLDRVGLVGWMWLGAGVEMVCGLEVRLGQRRG